MINFGWRSLVELLCWLALLCGLLVMTAHYPAHTSAQVPTPIISELYPAPASGEVEWVELFNPSSISLPLAGWWLSDELTASSIVYQFTTADGALAPGEYRRFVLSGSKLNNTGDAVRLHDASGGIQSRLSYSDAISGQSQQRTTLENEISLRSTPTPDQANEQYPLVAAGITPSPSPSPSSSTTPSPTPSTSPATTPSPTPTITPTPTPSPASPGASPSPSSTPIATTTLSAGQLSVTELSACPTDGLPEWIELYNAGGPLTATNWRITDQNGNYRSLSSMIQSGFTQLSWSGSLLNNAGDSFVLTSESGQIIDSVVYEGCTAGKSLIEDHDGNWQPSVPTPGAVNPTTSTPTPSPSATPVTSASTTASMAASRSSSTPIKPSPSSTTSPRQTAQSIYQVNPMSLVLTPSPSDSATPAIADKRSRTNNHPQTNSPTILGAADTAHLDVTKPWPLLFVIMAGLFFALSGVLPNYATTLPKTD